MSTISTVQARALLTIKMVALYKERVVVTSFLRSFFKEETSETKEISIEVQRGTEKIAVDVERGTEGNRNSFSKSTEKIFLPPYYREYFDMTDLNFYDRLFTTEGVVDLNTFSRWVGVVVESFGLLQDKIERAYEVQASQVFETGIVTLVNGTNINFGRKSAALVAYSTGHNWANDANDPTTILESGCDFLKTKGKMTGGRINAIVGTEALTALYNNAKFKATADVRRIDLINISGPRRIANTGAALHGELSVGSYTILVWTYPQFYDTKAALHVPYINPKKVILLPEDPKFVLSYAAVPQLLLGEGKKLPQGVSSQPGKYLLGTYIDEKNSSHIGDMKSAGITVPVGVDQIYTVQVVAD